MSKKSSPIGHRSVKPRTVGQIVDDEKKAKKIVATATAKVVASTAVADKQKDGKK